MPFIKKGMKISKEHKEKLSKAKRGKKLSKEHSKKISLAKKGKMPKNIDMIKGWNKGKKMPELSEKYKGKGNPMYGKKPWNAGMKIDREKYPIMGHFKLHTKETKKRLSENSKGQHRSPNTEFKKGKDAINWRGGIWHNPYSVDWTETLKRSIRERDRYICQLCGRGSVIQVHHIDYDKKNCNPNNLITLCKRCHSKTNYKRSYWKKYFQELIKVK